MASHATLETLHLSDNQLNGLASFSGPNLVNILVDNNDLSQLTLSPQVVAGLQRLTANDNQLTGSIPDLSAATSLQILNVARNSLLVMRFHRHDILV
jgi:Leucine-rich repeat (LRR) protein